jgi:hypothetical protein
LPTPSSNWKQEELPTELFIRAKKSGFSDYQIEKLIYKKPMPKDTIRDERVKRGILPVVKQIDTLAAEYPAQTNYLYLTYNGIANDVNIWATVARDRTGLGSIPHRFVGRVRLVLI